MGPGFLILGREFYSKKKRKKVGVGVVERVAEPGREQNREKQREREREYLKLSERHGRGRTLRRRGRGRLTDQLSHSGSVCECVCSYCRGVTDKNTDGLNQEAHLWRPLKPMEKHQDMAEVEENIQRIRAGSM